MTPRNTSAHFSTFTQAGNLLLLLAAVAMLLAAGCGSTKVYTADKTIAYNGNLYNMANVQRIGSRIDGNLPDGSTVKMKNLDRKEVEALLKEHPELMVSTIVEMDEQDMIYQRLRVKKYSEYDKMVDRFEGAMKDISKFMADKKQTQLKLK
jgi:hypothetical protein